MSVSFPANSLAIVIPVFKILYFERMLDSLASQTCKDFNIYIGDDCSPDDFETIVKRRSDLNISYTRFKKNLGSKDLIKQWERCIALSKDEKWIWVFSDDDIMSPNSVEKFYRALDLSNESFDVYKFNSTLIDGNDRVIEAPRSMPDRLNGYELVTWKMTGAIRTFVTDYIFSRRIFQQKMGFVNFPLAWGADDATWVKFSEGKGIYVIPDAVIYWRLSNSNISNPGHSGGQQKTLALLQYCKWMALHFNNHPDINQLKEKLRYFFFDQVRTYNVRLTPLFFMKVLRPIKALWNLDLPSIRKSLKK